MSAGCHNNSSIVEISTLKTISVGWVALHYIGFSIPKVSLHFLSKNWEGSTWKNTMDNLQKRTVKCMQKSEMMDVAVKKLQSKLN